jgi:hypothetical protein
VCCITENGALLYALQTDGTGLPSLTARDSLYVEVYNHKMNIISDGDFKCRGLPCKPELEVISRWFMLTLLVPQLYRILPYRAPSSTARDFHGIVCPVDAGVWDMMPFFIFL